MLVDGGTAEGPVDEPERCAAVREGAEEIKDGHRFVAYFWADAVTANDQDREFGLSQDFSKLGICERGNLTESLGAGIGSIAHSPVGGGEVPREARAGITPGYSRSAASPRTENMRYGKLVIEAKVWGET